MLFERIVEVLGDRQSFVEKRSRVVEKQRIDSARDRSDFGLEPRRAVR